jgi:hypothetical protein
MYRNEYMKKRLRSLDRTASEAPKRSLDEAMKGYEMQERLAAQHGRKESVPKRPEKNLEEFQRNRGK